jgi:Tat protein secretion system quality control protein TatD with DNase activity
MKIEIENKSGKYTWESSHDDYDIYTLAEHIKGLLVSAGFHPENVDEIFDEYSVSRWNLNKESEKSLNDFDDDFSIEETQQEVTAETLK